MGWPGSAGSPSRSLSGIGCVHSVWVEGEIGPLVAHSQKGRQAGRFPVSALLPWPAMPEQANALAVRRNRPSPVRAFSRLVGRTGGHRLREGIPYAPQADAL